MNVTLLLKHIETGTVFEASMNYDEDELPDPQIGDEVFAPGIGFKKVLGRRLNQMAQQPYQVLLFLGDTFHSTNDLMERGWEVSEQAS